MNIYNFFEIFQIIHSRPTSLFFEIIIHQRHVADRANPVPRWELLLLLQLRIELLPLTDIPSMSVDPNLLQFRWIYTRIGIQSHLHNRWLVVNIQSNLHSPWLVVNIQSNLYNPWLVVNIQSNLHNRWLVVNIQSNLHNRWLVVNIQSNLQNPWSNVNFQSHLCNYWLVLNFISVHYHHRSKVIKYNMGMAWSWGASNSFPHFSQ